MMVGSATSHTESTEVTEMERNHQPRRTSDTGFFILSQSNLSHQSVSPPRCGKGAYVHSTCVCIPCSCLAPTLCAPRHTNAMDDAAAASVTAQNMQNPEKALPALPAAQAAQAAQVAPLPLFGTYSAPSRDELETVLNTEAALANFKLRRDCLRPNGDRILTCTRYGDLYFYDFVHYASLTCALLSFRLSRQASS